MAIDTAPLQRLGLRLRPDEFESLVEEALAQVLPTQRITAPLGELTPEEARVLRQGGAVFEPRAEGVESPLVRTAAEYAALVASALTVAQAAEHLGVDGSRVRQRLGAGTLYGIKLSSGWRVPRFQLAERGVVPGFDRVAPRLTSVHPVSVARWFTRPHVDLVLDDDGLISPRDWLQMGRDPERVAALADELRGVG